MILEEFSGIHRLPLTFPAGFSCSLLSHKCSLCICVYPLFTLFLVSSLMWSVSYLVPPMVAYSTSLSLRLSKESYCPSCMSCTHTIISFLCPIGSVGLLLSALTLCSAFGAISPYPVLSTPWNIWSHLLLDVQYLRRMPEQASQHNFCHKIICNLFTAIN